MTALHAVRVASVFDTMYNATMTENERRAASHGGYVQAMDDVLGLLDTGEALGARPDGGLRLAIKTLRDGAEEARGRAAGAFGPSVVVPLAYNIREYARKRGEPPWDQWIDPDTGDFFWTTDKALAERKARELGDRFEVTERSWPNGHAAWCHAAHDGQCESRPARALTRDAHRDGAMHTFVDWRSVDDPTRMYTSGTLVCLACRAWKSSSTGRVYESGGHRAADPSQCVRQFERGV